MIPLVSVIIPTYSRPTTLDRAINSVLTQTYQNIEVIVVDDNNPGTEARALTETVMLQYKTESKVKYIQHEYNKNGSAARNTGVRNSKGDYIAFLDDDDIFLPKKIESQIEKMESLSVEWGGCYNAFFVQKEGMSKIKSKIKAEGDLFLDVLMQRYSFAAGSNILIRKNVYKDLNGFDESFNRLQDQEFLIRFLKKYKIAYVKEPGVIIVAGIERNVQIDYEVISRRYLETFKLYIDELSQTDKKNLYININKNRFYHFIRVKHEYLKAIKLILNGELPLSTALFFIFDLLYKYIREKKNNILNI